MNDESRATRQAGARENGFADRLRAGDPAATAAFLRSWIASVDRYCRTVCRPELVAQAIDVTFADFFDKLRAYPIADADLAAALMRCTRLTAGEGALVDDENSEDLDTEGIPAECEVTPLLLAGSPRAPVGVAVEDRMRRHLAVCPRCQATEERFNLAEKGFGRAAEPEIADRMLDAFLGQFATSPAHNLISEAGSASAPASPGRGATTDQVDTRRDLAAIKEGLLNRLRGLEFPLGELVVSMRTAMERESAASDASAGPHSQVG